MSESKTIPRGGKRLGAGGKPTWKNGKTKTIRVPITLADNVLGIARKLDDGTVIERDTSLKVIDLSGIVVPEIRGRRFVFLSDLVKAGYDFQQFKWADQVKAELREETRKRVNQSKLTKKA